MSLNVVEVKTVPIECGQNRGCAAGAVASMIVVTGGSAVVSGSIVLVGNTAHWLEYQGTCSDGYLARARNAFLAAIGQT